MRRRVKRKRRICVIASTPRSLPLNPPTPHSESLSLPTWSPAGLTMPAIFVPHVKHVDKSNLSAVNANANLPDNCFAFLPVSLSFPSSYCLFQLPCSLGYASDLRLWLFCLALFAFPYG